MLRQKRLADPAESQRRQRNAELRHRKRHVHLIDEVLRVFRALVPLRDQFLQLRETHLGDRELRRDEKAVQRDKDDNQQKIYDNCNAVQKQKPPNISSEESGKRNEELIAYYNM